MSEQPSPWPDRENVIPLRFEPGAALPLKETAKHLGRGSSAVVDVVICNGIHLARKRIFVPHRARNKLQEFKEGRILHKLSHQHVIQFAGSYIQGNVVGILMWPVAVCNLAQFMDAISGPADSDGSREILAVFDLDLGPLHPPLQTRGVSSWRLTRSSTSRLPVLSKEQRLLRSMFGCIANAMQYIHESNVRHKDIKPSNILVTPTSIYYADFGISHDVSDAMRERNDSGTDGPYRGTARYFAPEVANYQLRGRSADVFSLGCVFLEMATVLTGYTLKELDDFLNEASMESAQLRYCDKLPQIRYWIQKLSTAGSCPLPHEFLCNLLQKMTEEAPTKRYSSKDVAKHLYSLGGPPRVFHGTHCCSDDIAVDSGNPSSHIILVNQSTLLDALSLVDRFVLLVPWFVAVSFGLFLQRLQPRTYSFERFYPWGMSDITYIALISTNVTNLLLIPLSACILATIAPRWGPILLAFVVGVIPTDFGHIWKCPAQVTPSVSFATITGTELFSIVSRIQRQAD